MSRKLKAGDIIIYQNVGNSFLVKNGDIGVIANVSPNGTYIESRKNFKTIANGEPKYFKHATAEEIRTYLNNREDEES